MNYTDLIAFLKDWNEDDSTEFSDEIALVVARAEHRIFRDLPKLPCNKAEYTGNLSASTRTLAINSAIRVVRSFKITTTGTTQLALEQRNDDYLAEVFPDQAVEGTPRFFAIEDSSNFIFAPVPNSTYAYEIKALAKPTSIVSAATTWVGDNLEDLLQNACLIESKIFLEDQEGLAGWTAAYQASLQSATMEMAAMHASEYGVGV